MPEKINPYSSPATKVLSLYGLLLFSGKKYSLTQLAQLLRCSKQTVLRMMEQIELSHQAKIESRIEGGRKWFKIKTPLTKPLLSLDVKAIQHLMLCRDFVCHILPQSLREEISRTIAHTTVLLPDQEERSRAMAKLGEAYVKGSINYNEHQEYISLLLNAIGERRVCRVSYLASGRLEPKEYCIAPLTVIAHHGALYISCWLVTDTEEPEVIYDDMLLAVQRLLQVEQTERKFTIKEDCSIKESCRTFGLMKGEPLRIKIGFSPEVAVYVRERKWSDDQTIITLPDGGLMLEFTATSRPEVMSWVLSFGPEATVLSPEDLKDEIKKLANEMVKNYGQETDPRPPIN